MTRCRRVSRYGGADKGFASFAPAAFVEPWDGADDVTDVAVDLEAARQASRANRLQHPDAIDYQPQVTPTGSYPTVDSRQFRDEPRVDRGCAGEVDDERGGTFRDRF